MRFNPTTTQRRIVMAAAVVVAVLLYMQARSSGLDETPWLIGVLVIAGLLVAAFAPAQPVAAIPAKPTPLASDAIVPATAFRAARAVIEPAFVALAENANDAFELNVMTGAIVDHARVQAVKLAWIAAAMTIARTDTDFLKGERMAAYALVGGGAVRNLLKGMPGMAENGDKAVLTASAKEMAACSLALDLAMQGMATSRPHPMNPVYAMVEREFPFAQVSRPDVSDNAYRLDAAYAPLFRAAVAAVG